jgi:hypothetical protein
LHSDDVMECLPKKLLWTPFEMKHAHQCLVLSVPADVQSALATMSNELADEGRTPDSLEGHHLDERFDAADVKKVHAFGIKCRHRILDEVGACLLRGLDLSLYNPKGDYEDMPNCAKIAYYILSSLIGQVDGGARVSNTKAGWHTDGASVDRVYDVVSLLSLSQATSGGEFKVSNATYALENLIARIPKFFLYELLRTFASRYFGEWSWQRCWI